MNLSKKSVRLKPHHVLCTLCFEGNGYNQPFVENFSSIKHFLDNNPDASIVFTFGSDAICQPCPNRLENTCVDQQKISALDTAHAQMLGILPTEKLSWEEAVARVVQTVTLKKFNAACSGCSWKNLGICERKLSTLIGENWNP